MAGKRYPKEAMFLRFLASQHHEYIAQAAKWIEKEYPASAASMRPKMRELYKESKKREK